jgi:predicted nuclease of predicted toxin-antitoxin system
MRFLVDNALSPVLATLLSQAGHDALHVRTIELQGEEDIVIFDKAAAEDRIVVSADTDFGALLAARNVQKPSVIQFRGPGSRKPDGLSRAILSNLSQLADALEHSSIVTFEPSRIRVRALPINRASVD